MNSQFAQFYIEKGITPRKIEKAINNRTLSKLSNEYDCPTTILKRLARHWGIERTLQDIESLEVLKS